MTTFVFFLQCTERYFLVCNVRTDDTGSLLTTILYDIGHILAFGTCPLKVDLLGTSPQPSDLKCYYYSLANPIDPVLLTYDNACSTLQNNVPVKIVTHGYLHNGNTTWMLAMKDAYLTMGNAQVLLCDWSARSVQGYSKAADDIMSIGLQFSEK